MEQAGPANRRPVSKFETLKVTLSHAGKQHSYQVARALYNLGCLDQFHTSSYVTSSWWQQFWRGRQNRFWTRRFIDGLPGEKVTANWEYEVKEFLARQLTGKSRWAQNAVYERDMAFDRAMARKIEKGKIPGQVFWGFQGSACESIGAARAYGMRTILELSTAHVVAAKNILSEESRLHPEWADSMDNLEFPEEYEARLVKEPLLADRVIAASRFTRQSLIDAGVEEQKLIELPLGADVSGIKQKDNRSPENGPLKLLFAGTVTQRKGIKYLLEAVKPYQSRIELHIIGHLQGSGKAFQSQGKHAIYHGPVSQLEMFNRYRHYDFLVLPSVFEGFGLVLVEALAAGLPVIATPHTFGAELIREEVNGYLVPVRSVESLREVFEKALELTGDQYREMSNAARQTSLDYSWSRYEVRLKKVLDDLYLKWSESDEPWTS